MKKVNLLIYLFILAAMMFVGCSSNPNLSVMPSDDIEATRQKQREMQYRHYQDDAQSLWEIAQVETPGTEAELSHRRRYEGSYYPEILYLVYTDSTNLYTYMMDKRPTHYFVGMSVMIKGLGKWYNFYRGKNQNGSGLVNIGSVMYDDGQISFRSAYENYHFNKSVNGESGYNQMLIRAGANMDRLMKHLNPPLHFF